MRNRTLSNFSIAAIVMTFAAIPCLAQGNGSTEKPNLAAPVSGQLALNREPRSATARTGLVAVERKTIVEAAPMAPKALSLSALKSTEKGIFMVSPFEPAKPQFKSQNRSHHAEWGANFIPSRGPQAPGVKAIPDVASFK